VDRSFTRNGKLQELAHVNGADDAPSSTAEQMLPPCGFRDLFTPGI
jgi:hypothetical protein